MILHPSCSGVADSKPQAWGSDLQKEHKILRGSNNLLKLSNIQYYTVYINIFYQNEMLSSLKLFSLNVA